MLLAGENMKKIFEFKLFGYTLKIEFTRLSDEILAVDKLAKTYRSGVWPFPSTPADLGTHRKLTRVKAYRTLYNTGLAIAKIWVEKHFPDNGHGEL